MTRSGDCSAKVHVMRQIFTGKSKWHESKDDIKYDFVHVVKQIRLCIPVDSRGQFKFEV